MKIYVASSWRNEHQQQVVAELRSAGHEVYDFKHPAQGSAGFHWSEIDKNWQNWTTDQYRAALGHDYAKFGFNRDFDAMKDAEACVLVLPCGRSAHLEAGWMKGAGNKVIVYIPEGVKIEPELMYGLLDGITSDIQELLSWLKPAADTKFGLCNYPEQVLKIGRDFQNKDGFRGAHYDTVKLLCDTIEHQQEQLKAKTEAGDSAKLREAVEVCLHAFQTTDWTTLGTSGRVVDLIQRCKSALAATEQKGETMETNNNSKAREVLKRVHAFLSSLCRDARCDDHCSECLGASDLADDVYDLLHTLQRNCDVGTPEEQMKRQYATMCNTTKACPDSDWSCRKCFAKWAQQSYEEGGAK